jgi:branched-chain amino acid aminotransferase
MTDLQTNIHDAKIDPRNLNILISVNGKLYPRAEAMVSVFDSGFILGDGVWEGLRVVNGGVPFLRAHIERLYEGAKAIFMDIGLAPDALVARLFECIDANKMKDGVHVRLMVTRGVKSTPYQDPRATIGSATIVIIPEYKEPNPNKMRDGISLHTVNVRRGAPDVQDQKLNSHSKLNCITACIQAANAGADEALMLDPHGFVATCNSTHFFIIRRGELWTSSGQYCIPGITRGNLLRVARDLDIPAYEKQFSLYEVYGADEAFVTGTFAGLVPVRVIDGRPVRHPMSENNLSTEHWAGVGPVSQRLSEAYKKLCSVESTRSL